MSSCVLAHECVSMALIDDCVYVTPRVAAL